MILYEPNEIRAAEKVTAQSNGCLSEDRGISTPEADIALALTNDPKRFDDNVANWIDPKLAAVYVVGNAANGLCKIGYARELRKRVLGIQGSCPVPVVLHHFVYVVGRLVAKLVEAEVHECLGEERQHGEWFAVEPEVGAAMIHTVIKERNYKWWDEEGRRQLGFDAAKVHQRDWDRYSRAPRVLT